MGRVSVRPSVCLLTILLFLFPPLLRGRLSWNLAEWYQTLVRRVAQSLILRFPPRGRHAGAPFEISYFYLLPYYVADSDWLWSTECHIGDNDTDVLYAAGGGNDRKTILLRLYGGRSVRPGIFMKYSTINFQENLLYKHEIFRKHFV